jgi:aminopeptidase N
VIDAIGSRLSFTGDHLVTNAQRVPYQRWLEARFGPILTSLGIPGDTGDSDDLHSRRAELMTLLGVTADDAAIQRRARELAGRYIEDPSSLPGTLAPSVLRVAAAGGTRALYDAYHAQIRRHTANPEEYHRFFDALSWFRDPALIDRTLAFAVSDDVRSQDTGQLIAALLARPWSRDAAWTFVKAQWPTLTKRLGTFQGIPAIVGALGNFCSADAAADVRQFFNAHPVPAAQRTLRQALERTESCAALRERQQRPLTDWLQQM